MSRGLAISIAAILALVSAASQGGEGVARPGRPKAGPLKIVMLSWSLEYKSDQSLGILKEYLEKHYDARCTILTQKRPDDMPGLEALDDCDVLIPFTRRSKIEGEQLERVKKYCLAGRPIVGVRTASHAFQNWLALDRQVFGGNYKQHYGDGPVTKIEVDPKAQGHPILAGVKLTKSVGSLYKNTGLASDTQVLMTGTIPGHTEPIAWTRTYKGARIFYTSLGHPKDFQDENFLRMMANALFWAAGREPERK
jgi:type 1 glutamine amidotransferase